MSVALETAIPLYRQTAQRLERLIREGTIRVGERLPSVRDLSRDWSISVTTVMQSYRLLENQGLVEARPQSGFYVRALAARHAEEPDTSSPKGTPVDISRSELQMQILRDAARPGLLQLGAAIPDPSLLPIAKLNRIMASIGRRRPERSAGYEFSPGARELRTAIAKRNVALGLEQSPDEVLITSGGMEAISLALRVLCSPGDAVALESPTYYSLLTALEANGLRAIEVPTCPRAGMSLEALQVILEHHRPKVVLSIPSFQNPLGFEMAPERRQELVNLLHRHGVPLIEDDIYGELFHCERPRTCKYYDRADQVILLSSFSKTLAPGYRIGWVSGGRYHSELVRAKLLLNCASATLPQLAIAEFLEEGGYDHHLRGMRRELARRTDLLREFVIRYFPPETKVTRPAGGFLLWVQMPDRLDSTELYRLALARNIIVMPGTLFSPRDIYRCCIRLNGAFLTEKDEPQLAELGRLAHSLL